MVSGIVRPRARSPRRRAPAPAALRAARRDGADAAIAASTAPCAVVWRRALCRDGGTRRRMEWLVIRHFLRRRRPTSHVSAAPTWMHKASIGRAHPTTPHAWVGAATPVGRSVPQQPHVWRDQIRAALFAPPHAGCGRAARTDAGTAVFCETLIRPGQAWMRP